jgi:hypothetical protein
MSAKGASSRNVRLLKEIAKRQIAADEFFEKGACYCSTIRNDVPSDAHFRILLI